jgi:outer membrane protein OmpA-like peptidoglycan-associated protein
MTAIALLLALSGPAMAKGEPGVTFSVAGGGVWTDPNENLDSSWVVMPRLGYGINDRFGLETEVGITQGATRAFEYGYSATTPRLSAVVNLAPGAMFSPFLAAGAGLIYKDVHRPTTTVAEQSLEGTDIGNYKNPDTDMIVAGGPGFHLVLSGPLSLRVDFRSVVNIGSEPHGDIPDQFYNWEVVAGFAWRDAERRRDTDGDGLVDKVDECVLDPEDRDDFQDADGCPDEDNDEDGIADEDDDCRDDPEDMDRYKDRDGCPEDDNDKDGLVDEVDECPNKPEDLDGRNDQDGCPDEDNDEDGIGDLMDQCPNHPEDVDDFQDDDGCPEPDNDGDAILDIRDACPLEAETYNQNSDEDGCPDDLPPPPKEIERFTGVIHGINFKSGSDEITVDSYKVLDEAAAVLVRYPEIRLEVQGHTDSDGSEAYNLDLSARRARSVVLYLANRGVEPARLEYVGYGEGRPLMPGNRPAAKAVNRRVEFHILP